MTRRTISLVSAGVVLFALLLVSFYAPMPYVVMSPGLTENTLGTYRGVRVIQVEGHKTYPTNGQLDLTTVSVTSPNYSPRLAEVMKAWWDKDEIVIPRDIAYPPSQTVKQVEQQNRRDMTSSQDTAIAAGLAEAGIRSKTLVVVTDVEEDAPADGVLRRGDAILSVDGVATDTIDTAIARISKVTPGDRVDLEIQRDGKKQSLTVGTKPADDDPETARIGVTLGTRVDPPFDVKITLGAEIGGPSAGSMFALAVYDTITPGALTGGRHVAGTGTISLDGRVGVIGGIQQKIAGAYRDGATVFLVPAGDCEQAASSPLADDIRLVRVANIHDAVSALRDIDAGKASSVPSCDEG